MPLVALAMALRIAWVLAVPTVPVGDFATYRESANYLLQFGTFDPGFIYMPGFVMLLAAVASLGGELLAQKMLGVLFGTLAAAAVFGVTAHLADDGEGPETGDGIDPGVDRGCATAIIATLLYALWPAGVALSSVVGTDVPAAALIMLALWALTAWGPRRPVWAAVGFGVLMGLAAYVRAVALPLTLMSAAYWATRRGRKSWREVAQLTALATAATLVVLLPWALHNRRAHGALSFTDDHGGITALIGANPNSEATYSRALNRMFKDLTGRTVLDEPHRETDRMAFDLAKDWTRFEPWYAVGLVVLKAERLYWAEWHLLYWPIGRPGVLIGGPARWFAAHEEVVNRLTDAFWFALCGLFASGVALAVWERRWRLLALVPFQVALTATYAIFFAEPRYRLPIQMMAFPIAAFTLRRLWVLARAHADAPAHRGQRARFAFALGLATASAVTLFVVAPAVVAAGERLRVAHRWAATVWSVDGQSRLARWRRHGATRGASPIAGAPNGARLTLGGGGPAEAEIVTVPIPAGRYRVHGEIEASDLPAPPAASALRFELEDTAGRGVAAAVIIPSDRAAAPRVPVDGRLVHAGGPLRLVARVAATGREALGGASVWISSFDLRSVKDADALGEAGAGSGHAGIASSAARDQTSPPSIVLYPRRPSMATITFKGTAPALAAVKKL